MTRSIDDMQPDEVLREYFKERMKHECPKSSAGGMEDHGNIFGPRYKRQAWESKDKFESLILMTQGCDKIMLECMYAASAMYQLASWQCGEAGCQQVVLHEHRPVIGTDGRPLVSGGVEITQAVTVAVRPSAVAEAHGIPLADVKRRIASVLAQVAENQGRRRVAVVDEYEEDPAVGAWRSWMNGGM